MLFRSKICCGKEPQRNKHADVRDLFALSEPGRLERAVETGAFRKDLYYLLKGLCLNIPPLRECREDVKQLLENTVRDCCERFDRYHVFTPGAMEALLNYPWPGNRYQVENFCERLVLTASKRLLDEKMVLGVLTELFEKAERKQDLQTANTKEAADRKSVV